MTFEPDAFIADLGMLVQVYPHDRRLPALPLLLGGPPPNLERLLLAELVPGDWQAVAWQVEPGRYRAGLAAVLRYELEAREAATGRREGRRFYLKVYREGDACRRTFDAQQTLWEMTPAGGDRFAVGKPIAYLPDLRALIQAEVPGTSLEALMLQGADTKEAIGRIARALAAFNQAAVVAPRLRLLDDQVEALQRVGKLLQWACPPLGQEVAAIVSEVSARLEAVPTGPMHRDLKADHFLLDGDRLGLLDLDSLVAADPVLDPATLLAQFASMPFRFPLSHEQMQATSQVFTDEYFAHAPRDWRRRLPVHYAGAALHVAVGFFRRQEPRWPETVATLVGQASACLAGRIW